MKNFTMNQTELIARIEKLSNLDVTNMLQCSSTMITDAKSRSLANTILSQRIMDEEIDEIELLIAEQGS